MNRRQAAVLAALSLWATAGVGRAAAQATQQRDANGKVISVTVPANVKALQNAGQKSQGRGVASVIKPAPAAQPIMLQTVTRITTTQQAPACNSGSPAAIQAFGWTAAADGQLGLILSCPNFGGVDVGNGWWFQSTQYFTGTGQLLISFVRHTFEAGKTVTVDYTLDGVAKTVTVTIPSTFYTDGTYVFAGTDGRLYNDPGLTQLFTN